MNKLIYLFHTIANGKSEENLTLFTPRAHITELQTLSGYVLQIQGKDIERVTKFNYLGVILDEQLHWKEHTDSICNKVNKRLGLLARIRSCLTLKAAKCVYNTLIEPILCHRVG